ncbi:uncharacterized protein FFNC_14200 [Fusarium fujikuroi]|nr:uncharacterized protein FFC1_14828 [Fusarium fujikuroi]SCO52215.1 uncharacterized protein FFNC_14200 [Fusarium fujikuroi]
MARSNN